MQVAAFECGDLALCRTQFEEEFLLVRGSADLYKGPRTQDVILDGCPDPPNGVGGEPKALFRFKAVHCLQQADIAFGDDFRDGKTVAAVTHGDLGGKTQMTGNEPVCGITVAMLAPTFGKPVLLVFFEHFEAPDIVEIAPTVAISDKGCFAPCSSCEARELSLNAHIIRSVVDSISAAVRNSGGSLNDKHGVQCSH